METLFTLGRRDDSPACAEIGTSDAKATKLKREYFTVRILAADSTASIAL